MTRTLTYHQCDKESVLLLIHDVNNSENRYNNAFTQTRYIKSIGKEYIVR